MKEHPPESIVIWNQYLVYATALGVADKVYESMKLHVGEGNIDDDYLDSYYYYGTGYYMMHNAIDTGIQTAPALVALVEVPAEEVEEHSSFPSLF